MTGREREKKKKKKKDKVGMVEVSAGTRSRQELIAKMLNTPYVASIESAADDYLKRREEVGGKFTDDGRARKAHAFVAGVTVDELSEELERRGV